MKIAVLGAAGRMGQALARACLPRRRAAPSPPASRPKARPRSAAISARWPGLEPLGIAITDDPLPVFADVDGVLDFTSPTATVAFAGARGAGAHRPCHRHDRTHRADDQAKIEAAARHATIVKAGNMSLGVNLLAALTERVAQALGPEFDIEILELHHRHKRDAPSGTSLMLGEAAAKARDISLAEHGVRDPRRRHRPTARGRYRLCGAARRRRGRRAPRDLRRPRRAHRACPCRHRPWHFCPRRGQGRALGARPGPRASIPCRTCSAFSRWARACEPGKPAAVG